MLHPNISFPLLPVTLHTSPPPSLPFTSLFEKRMFPSGCQLPLLLLYAHQVAAGLGTSFPTESNQGCAFRGADSTGRQATASGTAPAPDVVT